MDNIQPIENIIPILPITSAIQEQPNIIKQLDNTFIETIVPSTQNKPNTDTKLDNIDILYNKIILNTGLLVIINNLKVKGFTGSDIPVLILTIMNIYNSYTLTPSSHKLTIDDVQTLLERVYNYLVEKYNLIESENRSGMFILFETSLTLCLTTPNVKKDVNKCLKFFNCAK